MSEVTTPPADAAVAAAPYVPEQRWSRRRTVLTVLAAGVLGLAVVAGLVIALGMTVLRGAPGFDRLRIFAERPEPVATKAPFTVRVPGAVLPDPAGSVLPGLGDDAPSPSASGLAGALAPLISAPGLGRAVSVDVVDPATGRHLLSQSPAVPRAPASTAKLLTGAAALTLLGAQSTLPTTVVQGPGSQILLVGGGDVLLGRGDSDDAQVNGRAGLGTLARQTTTALREQGRTSVTLRLDDGLFDDESRSPNWSPTDVSGGYVAPVMPAEIDAGRLTRDDYAHRSADPAMAAADAFAAALRKQGISVHGTVRRGSAAQGSVQLAQVQSATVGQQVEFALTQSDNTVAEALARLVAVRLGTPATFAGAGQAVLAQMAVLGVEVRGATMTDGSGLGDGSKIPAQALTGVLSLAGSPDHLELRPLLSGLPVAAVSGTLTDRFAVSSQKPARGVVRAKTGTLSGVSSLAGTAVDADGRRLVFAVLADRVSSTLAARKALDDVASTLASCGCR